MIILIILMFALLRYPCNAIFEIWGCCPWGRAVNVFQWYQYKPNGEQQNAYWYASMGLPIPDIEITVFNKIKIQQLNQTYFQNELYALQFTLSDIQHNYAIYFALHLWDAYYVTDGTK
jgi:hypothetical protein